MKIILIRAMFDYYDVFRILRSVYAETKIGFIGRHWGNIWKILKNQKTKLLAKIPRFD